MSTAPSQPPFITLEEYLRLEALADERHDYLDGHMIAMSGGSPDHALVTANLIREVGNALKGHPCRVYGPDLRIGSKLKHFSGSRMHYPDASIVCGPLEFDPRDSSGHTIINPTVIFEVLSPSTEDYDRGRKLDHYFSLGTVKDCVLIRQDRAEIMRCFRQADQQMTFDYSRGLEAKLVLPSLNISLSLAEIYAGVEFPPEPED